MLCCLFTKHLSFIFCGVSHISSFIFSYLHISKSLFTGRDAPRSIRNRTACIVRNHIGCTMVQPYRVGKTERNKDIMGDIGR